MFSGNPFWKEITASSFWMGKSQKHGKVSTSPNSSHRIWDYMIIIRIKQISKCFMKYSFHSVVGFFFSVGKLRHSQGNRFEQQSFRAVNRAQASWFLSSSQNRGLVTPVSMILLETTPLSLIAIGNQVWNQAGSIYLVHPLRHPHFSHRQT